MTDWQALAARFEAADETTIYGLVGELVEAAGRPIRRAGLTEVVERAIAWRLPILLLGPVAACMPEGWTWSVQQSVLWGTRGALLPIYGGLAIWGKADIPAAALAAAICRAYAEIERETANDAA